jgi:membrane-associated phospholipid phosphatase
VATRPSRAHLGSEISFVVVLGALFVVAQLTDSWIFHHLAYKQTYDYLWGHMLRLVGYAPLWALVALAFGLHDRVPGTPLQESARRGLLVFGCPAAAGLVADVLKLVLRRERPYFTDGVYVLRPWFKQPFSAADLGLPSGEAAVAFAAAAILARLLPEASLLWYLLATGCALTRVSSGDHFMSDVVLGALVGYVVTVVLWRIRPLHATTPDFTRGTDVGPASS